jgi:hypothetical protein
MARTILFHAPRPGGAVGQSLCGIRSLGSKIVGGPDACVTCRRCRRLMTPCARCGSRTHADCEPWRAWRAYAQAALAKPYDFRVPSSPEHLARLNALEREQGVPESKLTKFCDARLGEVES